MRIIAFGCSNTYGHGLPDCISEDKKKPGSNPSRFAWPALLSNKLKCEHLNLANPGNSNKEIWFDVMNFDFQKTDIVVITWSYIDRVCIIEPNNIRRINLWEKDNESYFARYSDSHDMLLDFYCRLNHVNLYLDSIGIKSYNFSSPSKEENKINFKWNKANLLNFFKRIDIAEDGIHPGVLSHQMFSDHVYKKIKEDV